MFKKKKKVEYTTYEADELYYQETIEEINPPQNRRRDKKNRQSRGRDESSYGLYKRKAAPVNEKGVGLFSKITLIIVAAYILFLVTGIITTTYTEGGDGKKRAQVITIAMMKERESFYKIKEHYHKMQNLIIDIEETDAVLANSEDEDWFKISVKYQDILPRIDKILPSARAMDVNFKYENIKNQVGGIYESIAIYLQKMGTALIDKNATTYEEALTWQAKYKYDFEQFRLNMIEFAKMVNIQDEELNREFFMIKPEEPNSPPEEEDAE